MSTVSWLEGAGLPASRTQLVTRAPQLTVWLLAAALGVQAAVIVTHLAGSGGARPRREPVAARQPVLRPEARHRPSPSDSGHKLATVAKT